VLLYSAYADASLVVPAIIAGADGIVPKSVPSRQLFEAIRTVAKGGTALPPISPDLLQLASRCLEPEDLPVLDMLVNHIARRDIADTLGIGRDDLAGRIAAMLDRIKAPVGIANPPAPEAP